MYLLRRHHPFYMQIQNPGSEGSETLQLLNYLVGTFWLVANVVQFKYTFSLVNYHHINCTVLC